MLNDLSIALKGLSMMFNDDYSASIDHSMILNDLSMALKGLSV